ncbi:MAG: TolB family protein, partial [Chitinophagales bacterium]
MKHLLVIVILVGCILNWQTKTFAQNELPNTDIYLLDISTDQKGKMHFENPSLVVKNDKYDNQPWWSTDGTYLLYCSVRDTSKADVYKYTLSTSKNM